MRRRSCTGPVACAGVGCLGFVLALGGFLYVTLFTNVIPKAMGERTFAFRSDTRNLDPFLALEEARQYAGKGARLTAIEARFVRSDGTMNLHADYAPSPEVEYRFVAPAEGGGAALPPVGAGGSPGATWIQDVTVRGYRPGRVSRVQRTTATSRTEYTFRNEGMVVNSGSKRSGPLPEGLAPPQVSTKRLWELAIAAGAPEDAVATIEYDKDGYRFSITGTKVRLSFELDGTPK